MGQKKKKNVLSVLVTSNMFLCQQYEQSNCLTSIISQKDECHFQTISLLPNFDFMALTICSSHEVCIFFTCQ